MSARPAAAAGPRARSREAGVALVQVLLITGIIGLLMLQLALSAHEQVGRAQLVADRIEAELRARSRESAVLYTLLTAPWAHDEKSENPYVAVWNFAGERVEFDQAQIRLQDQCGLLPVTRASARQFAAQLRALGVEPARAERLAFQLLAREGEATGLGPSPGATASAYPSTMGRYPLQSLAELRQLPDMDAALYHALAPLLTLYPTRNFNPLTAPAAVLAARLQAAQLASVLELRSQARLDASRYIGIAGDDPDEFTVLTPGPGIAVDVDLDFGSAHAHRHLVAGIDPYGEEAVSVWEQSSRGGPP